MQNFNRALIAVALLGATAAFAQSSVTLYGRINTTAERQKAGNATVTGLFNNSSRFGFKGAEDLGNGLKAGFQLESGFNSDTGQSAASFFGRQSEVNLSGNFGTVRLGNFFPESYFATADYVSLHNHDTGSSADALYVDPIWYGVPGATNKIAYRTPDLGGLTVEGSRTFHENNITTDTGRKAGYDLAANYAIGALALGGGYTKIGDGSQFGVRAFYTFGQFLVGGYYQRTDHVNPFAAGSALVVNNNVGTRNNFRLSGAYLLGASEFHVNVGRSGDIKGLAGDTGATQYTLGYNYNLSKRTKVYGYYTRVDNDAAASYQTGRNGTDFSSVALGVRHAF